MVTSMKTSLTLFATVALLALAANSALAGDDYRRGGAHGDRDQSHYRGGDYRGNGHPGRGFRARHDYRPRHEYHYYHEARPVYYHRPSHYYSYSPSHHHGYEHHRHHDHHDGRDLIAIIGGAVLVHEILNH